MCLPMKMSYMIILMCVYSACTIHFCCGSLEKFWHCFILYTIAQSIIALYILSFFYGDILSSFCLGFRVNVLQILISFFFRIYSRHLFYCFMLFNKVICFKCSNSMKCSESSRDEISFNFSSVDFHWWGHFTFNPRFICEGVFLLGSIIRWKKNRRKL